MALVSVKVFVGTPIKIGVPTLDELARDQTLVFGSMGEFYPSISTLRNDLPEHRP
jgi:hypothetical protein